MVLFDIDYFKRINDEWGHDTGDAVLARTSAVLAGQARDIDVVGRLGGEEFAVLMPSCDAEGAAILADRVRDAVARAESPGLPSVRMSAGSSRARPLRPSTSSSRRPTSRCIARSGRDATARSASTPTSRPSPRTPFCTRA